MRKQSTASDARLTHDRMATRRESGSKKPGAPSGEHSDQKPEHGDGRRDDDEAPATPTDEPSPIPVLDPPSDERPRPPLTVHHASASA